MRSSGGPAALRSPAPRALTASRAAGSARAIAPLPRTVAHQETESPEPLLTRVLGLVIANICTLYLCHINQFHCCLSPFMSILIFFLSICLLPNVFHYPHLRLQSVNNREYIHCFPFSVKAPKAPCSHSCKSLCDREQFSSLSVFENRNSANKHSPDFFSKSKGPTLHGKCHKLWVKQHLESSEFTRDRCTVPKEICMASEI